MCKFEICFQVVPLMAPVILVTVRGVTSMTHVCHTPAKQVSLLHLVLPAIPHVKIRGPQKKESAVQLVTVSDFI